MKRLTRSRKWTHSLSLCMIVKNEAESLEKCLRLARPYVDEVVIVDTGSTDGTREIAQRYADVYDEIEWPDSFAKARNYSIDLASCEFILILDGDEYIEDAHQWKALRKVLTDGIVGILLPVCNLMGGGGIMRSDRAVQRRVFLNHPDIRYIGRVHNQIGDSIVEYGRRHGLRERIVEAEVVHTGYSYDPEAMKKKYWPRLQLMLDEYHNPTSEHYRAYYGYQLGVYYKILEEYEKAIEVLSEVQYHRLTDENAFYGHLVAALSAIHLNRYEVAAPHCDAMFRISRIEPISYFAAGYSMFNNGDHEEGLLMTLQSYLTNRSLEARQARFALNAGMVIRYIGGMCYEAGLTRYGKAFHALWKRDEPDTGQAAEIVRFVRDEVAAKGLREAA